MTREEFKDGLAIITHPETDLKYFNEWISRITKHDAEQRAEISQAQKTNEYLASQIRQWEQICGDKQAEVARLREALQAIVDVQNGPPLEKYREAWEGAMSNAERLLKETR